MKDAYRKDWDWYSRRVDERKDSEDWAQPRRVRESHWEEFFDIGPGDRVLDAGCGHGDYTVLALERAARVWAFDYSPEMAVSTKKRVRRYALQAESVSEASVTEIPYADESFDVALCLAVLDHLVDADAVRAVRELARVAKPQARIYLNVPNKHAYPWRAGHWLMQLLGRFPPGDTRWYTPKELEGLARAVGLVPGRSLGLWALPPFSGVYTADMQRFSILPKPMIRFLDRAHLGVEKRLRRIGPLKGLCHHYFLEVRKA